MGGVPISRKGSRRAVPREADDVDGFNRNNFALELSALSWQETDKLIKKGVERSDVWKRKLTAFFQEMKKDLEKPSLKAIDNVNRQVLEQFITEAIVEGSEYIAEGVDYTD